MIDRDVAEYWRENYDLTNILRWDWETLWPKLRGKLHIFVGDMDTFYLNKCARRPIICCSSVQILLICCRGGSAVYLFEELLKEKEAEGRLDATEYEIDYGDRAEHCWNVRNRPCKACAGLIVHKIQSVLSSTGRRRVRG